jgi:DNA invertase Pin-like site-specific DNA recombinase
MRFSSAKQRKGDSARRQAAFADRVCKRSGWLLDDSLNLKDMGVSAFRGKNAATGALSGFIEAVQSGRVQKGSILIVENIDRLSRNKVSVALQLFIQILNLGITIVTYEPHREYTQDSINDIAALIEPIIYMARAYDESRVKSMRVRGKWGQRRQRAEKDGTPMTSVVPGWLTVTDGKFAVVEENAWSVRSIFRLAAEGLGLSRILRTLNDDPAAYPPFGRSGRWTRSYVYMLLNWPAVYGDHQRLRVDPDTGKVSVDGLPLKGYFPAVVTEEEFYLAQSAVRGRRGRTGRPCKGETNLFTGLVRYAPDDSSMVLFRCTPTGRGRQVRSEAKRYTYIVSHKTTHGVKCHDLPGFSRAFQYKPFEGAVLRVVRELTPADVCDRPSDADVRDELIRSMTADLTAYDHKLQQLQEQLVDPKVSPTALSAYIKAVEQTSLKKDQTIARLTELKAAALSGWPETLGQAHSVIDLLEKTSGEEGERLRRRLKSLLRLLVKEIRVVVEAPTTQYHYCHVKVYLRTGEERYVGVACPDRRPPGFEHLDLEGVDFTSLSNDVLLEMRANQTPDTPRGGRSGASSGRRRP